MAKSSGSESDDAPKTTFDDLKETRTRAYQKFKHAVRRVEVGILKAQESLQTSFLSLEERFCQFHTAHEDFSEYCKENKVATSGTGTSSVVNGKSLEDYYKVAVSEYDSCVTKYKNHVASLPVNVIPAQNSPPSSNVGISGSAVSASPFSGNFMYQRKSYPLFNGKPGRDWLEWKTLCVKEVQPLFVNKPIVMAELYRDMVKGSPAEKVIKHISLAEEDCASKIWNCLVSHYDNIGINVQTVLNGLQALKVSNER